MSRVRAIFVSHAYRDADLYHALIGELRTRGHFRFRDTSVPDISQIEAKNPKAAIRRKIDRCDVMLAFTRPIATRSKYIQYELETATKLGKPIIAIRPLGDRHISSVVRKAASIVIDWDIEEVVRQIRKPGTKPLHASEPLAEIDDSANIVPLPLPDLSKEPKQRVGDVLRRIFSRAFALARPPGMHSPLPSDLDVVRRTDKRR